jgi:hypothetical protein
MTYACPTWEFAADTHLMKLQRLQNRVLRAIGNLDWRTPVRDLHLAFKIPYVYDFFSIGATAPIWALAYLHETLRFTSAFF